MFIRSVSKIPRKVSPGHGETTLYQHVFGSGTSDEKLTKTIRGFWRMTVKPGGTNKLHTHADQEQIYFVVRGSGMVSVGDEKARLKAGDAVYLPPRLSHAFYNDTEKPCTILAVSATVYVS